MINLQNQIDYWKTTSLEDLESAKILIDKGKLLHGLFFCHLTIEKIMKAHYVKENKTLAPKTHDLIYLLNKTRLTLSSDQELLMANLMTYQLEGRYPDYPIRNPDREKAIKYLNETKELMEWLIQKL